MRLITEHRRARTDGRVDAIFIKRELDAIGDSPLFLRRPRALCANLAALGFALSCAGLTACADAAQIQVLKGHVPAAVATQQPVGNLAPSTRLDLAIGLPLRNAAQLSNLLQQLYQPASPNFRRYLTPEQFTTQFGPTQRDYQAVIDFATAHGLKVTGAHSNRTLVDVNGTVADIEKAFHVNLRLFQHPTQARQFFAPDINPSVELDTPLLAISGLDNFVVPHPNLRRIAKSSHHNGNPLAGSGSGGTYMGKDFRAAYAPGVALTGAGQSVGLFELDGYRASDITNYASQSGLPNVPLQAVLIDGFNGSSSAAYGGDEVALDIEMAASMASGLSSILVYEGPPPPTAVNTDTSPVTTTHVNDVLNRMATDDKALQLSCSWGFDINPTTQQIFKQYAAQGQSFFLACGDTGAFVGAVTEPADDPYITVVGGTTLSTTGPAGSWVSETTWNSGNSILGVAATGGGISTIYPIPVWQQGVDMSTNQGSTTMRNTPDVALIADNIWFIYAGRGSEVGGTSVAAPLWAAFAALVNQQAATDGLAPLGFANPAIYAIGKSSNYAACFHDITTGDNTTPSSPSAFYAAPGYDLCTGWGTPTGGNLIQALLAPPAESLFIMPPFGFTASGPTGGPFNVSSQTYSLTNIGSSPLNWSLINTSSWLTVSATAGTLNPGGPDATVTAALNPAASNLLIGNYSANLWISNLTDGAAQYLKFYLLVGNGGFETGDFTDWTLSGSTNDNFVIAVDDTQIDGAPAFAGVNDWQFVHTGLYGAFLGQSSTTAFISQTVPTTPGRQYLLSFWFTSVPFQGSTTPSGFVANWNGTTLLYQTNLAAFDWTNAQFIVSATSTNTALQFGARDDPAAIGLDDVSVQALAAPSFQAVTHNAGAITLVWSAAPGMTYQIQYTDALSPPRWIDLGPAITATNSIMSASDTLSSSTQRFYRIVQSFQ